EAARLQGESGRLISQIAQLRGQISQIDIEALRMDAAVREEAITELRELGFRELELKERRLSLIERLSRLEIRAPRPGTVLDMTVHAIKSVVRPAEPILYVVPSDSDLIVDARVDPLNRDQVDPRQETVLRFSGLNTRTTPELFGEVKNISRDSIVDEQTGMAYYKAEVAFREGELEKLEGEELIAGMPVEVYIQTGDRTPLNYMVKPITDYFNRAMRED
ncbi:MAG: HlyD family efflux transporter periplasmic adaptor subunit, partial [Pseudomonadota bacterium]